MAAPYALDFSPLSDAIESNRREALLRNKLAIEQGEFAMRKSLHPGALAAQQEAIRHAGAWNPLLEKEKASDIAQKDLLDPLDVRSRTADVFTKEEALAAQRRFRLDPYGDNPPPNAATARIPQSQYAQAAPAPPGAASAAPGGRSVLASKTADTIETHVLKWPDPTVAETNWKTFLAQPEIAPKWQQHVQAYGVSGDWKRDASDFVRDMRHEANGNVLKPWQAASAAGAGMVGAGGGASQQQAAAPAQQPINWGPQAPPQQGAATPPPPQPQPVAQPQPAAQPLGTPQQMAALAALNRDKRLYQNMIREGINVAAAETGLKNVIEQEKMGQYNVPGAGMVSLPGFAENQARTKGMEKEAESQQANYEKANMAVADSHALARKAREIRALAPQSILGSGAEYELAARKIASRLGYVDPRIAASELLRSGLTQFVSAEAQKLKPVSASDIAFVQQSIGGLTSDPSSLPHIAAAWDTAAQRQALYHELESQSYVRDIPELGSRKGYPNRAAILNYVDQKVPSYVESMLNGQGAQTGKAPQQGEAPKETPAAGAPVTKDALMQMPDGPVFNGTYIKRGTQLFPVHGELGTEGNPLAKKTDVTGAGQHAFENGKVYRRNNNWIADRWEEVLPPATTQRGPR